MSIVDSEALGFFYDNAGYSWAPTTQTQEEGRRETARRLAEAERAVRVDPVLFYSMMHDTEPYEGDVPYDGPVWVVTLWRMDDCGRPEVLASVGNVAVETEHDPYIRVVQAELAVEYLLGRDGK